jgi:hypothetical protein
MEASYSSPGGTQKFTYDLPPLPGNNVSDKTNYLNALRSKSSELQGAINAFLTQKMEEDAKAAESGGAKKKSKKEEREEEMYGEEDPEAE